MIDKSIIDTITRYCIKNLDFETSGRGWEYFYSSLALCVIDSVYSIGVRYEGVTNTINHFCAFFDIQSWANKKHKIPNVQDQIPTSEFVRLLTKQSPDFLANQIYQNRQRTSSNNGILKAEAINRFLKILVDFRIEFFQDVHYVVNNESFDFCIKNIPGQRSGISLKYFFMLAGSEDLIKPDRMIVRFLNTVTGVKFKLDECQIVLTEVATELNKAGYSLTPQALDNTIWAYQRLK